MNAKKNKYYFKLKHMNESFPVRKNALFNDGGRNN